MKIKVYFWLVCVSVAAFFCFLSLTSSSSDEKKIALKHHLNSETSEEHVKSPEPEPTTNTIYKNSSSASVSPVRNADASERKAIFQPDSNSVIEYSKLNYPDYYYGDLSLFSNNKHYAKSVAEANVDNIDSEWSRTYRQLFYGMKSFIDANIVGEQFKCSSQGCLLTGIVSDVKYADKIFDELQNYGLWKVYVNAEKTSDGKYIIFVRKGADTEDKEKFEIWEKSNTERN